MGKTIKRKSMLYKTRVDYDVDSDGKPINDYAMNHVLGCVHGCKYPCYAMESALRFKTVESYKDWCEPKLVDNTLELLERELSSRLKHEVDGSGPYAIHKWIATLEIRGLSDKHRETFKRIAALHMPAGFVVDLENPLSCENGVLRVRAWFESYEESGYCKHSNARRYLALQVKRIKSLTKRICTVNALGYKEPVNRVHLCFTTDPFPYFDNDIVQEMAFSGFGEDVPAQCEIQDMTMAAAELINENGIPVTVLTKGVLPQPVFDLDGPLCLERPGYSKTWDMLHPDNYYGISLVSLSEGFREKWEPYTAPYQKRIASLHGLHESGFKTWVSMEPFPAITARGCARLYGETETADLDAPDRSMSMLIACLEAVSFVDRIVFGRWNYNTNMPTDVADVDGWYREASRVVKQFCEERGIERIIKKGTG